MINYISTPSILIAIGSILVVIGGFWASLEQSAYKEKLSSKNEEIIGLNNQINYSITGGDSYSYLSINKSDKGNKLSTVIVHSGDYPLYDLTLRIVDLDKFGKISGYWGEVLNIGNLPAGMARTLEYKIDFSNRKLARLNIFISARNGHKTQLLRVKSLNGKWFFATQVKLDDGKIVFEKIDDELKSEESTIFN